ncbi:hypothetical protein QQ045_031025 [Rhodiola kirilowii]
MKMTSWVEVTAFDGKADFGVWKLKIKALLSHHKIGMSLEKEDKWSVEQKARKETINEEAFNLLIVNLADSVIRKDAAYANKTVANLPYLKSSLFAFKMSDAKSVDDNLDDFLKMTLLLSGTPHEVDEVSKVMILMNALPNSYQVVKDAFQYTGTVPSYELFCSALRTREFELNMSKSNSGSSLYVKHKSNHGRSNKPKSVQHAYNFNSDDESQNNPHESWKCFHCGKLRHI